MAPGFFHSIVHSVAKVAESSVGAVDSVTSNVTDGVAAGFGGVATGATTIVDGIGTTAGSVADVLYYPSSTIPIVSDVAGVGHDIVDTAIVVGENMVDTAIQTVATNVIGDTVVAINTGIGKAAFDPLEDLAKQYEGVTTLNDEVNNKRKAAQDLKKKAKKSKSQAKNFIQS
jgi:hypothetical protein